VNLILIGVRGAGKSAVGAALAGRLRLDFVDLDSEIERRAGRSIVAIFEEDGEAAFRELESKTLLGLKNRRDCVLATGGGVVLSGANRQVLRSMGKVIWLQVDPANSVSRLSASHWRPPLTRLSPLDEARSIADQRRRFYQEASDQAVATDGRSVEEVCDELEQLWHAI